MKARKAYSEMFELVHRREADGPNAIWQADYTPLDSLFVRSDGQIAKRGRYRRLQTKNRRQ